MLEGGSGTQAADKAQRQHLDNLRQEATEERQRELEKGAHQALHALAPIYSLVILQHSTYKQVRPLSTVSACPVSSPMCQLGGMLGSERAACCELLIALFTVRKYVATAMQCFIDTGYEYASYTTGIKLCRVLDPRRQNMCQLWSQFNT